MKDRKRFSSVAVLESRGMNIAIGSLNYDIILEVERMLFEHEKLSLFISCHFWLSGGCRSCAIAWGGESLIPVKEEEIGKVFTLFVKLTLPFQVVSMWMVRAISQQNGEPELHPRPLAYLCNCLGLGFFPLPFLRLGFFFYLCSPH